MECDRAVKEMMVLDVKTNSDVPPELYPFIRTCLARMWQVGFEENTIRRSHKHPISQYTMNGDYIRSYDGVAVAARMLNINRGNISHVLNGTAKSAGGFIWRYKISSSKRDH